MCIRLSPSGWESRAKRPAAYKGRDKQATRSHPQSDPHSEMRPRSGHALAGWGRITARSGSGKARWPKGERIIAGALRRLGGKPEDLAARRQRDP